MYKCIYTANLLTNLGLSLSFGFFLLRLVASSATDHGDGDDALNETHFNGLKCGCVINTFTCV